MNFMIRLGININHDMSKKLLRIHQMQYILKMIEKYGLSEVKPVSTPADLNSKFEGILVKVVM